jgi:hypothetical protein
LSICPSVAVLVPLGRAPEDAPKTESALVLGAHDDLWTVAHHDHTMLLNVVVTAAVQDEAPQAATHRAIPAAIDPDIATRDSEPPIRIKDLLPLYCRCNTEIINIKLSI